MLRAPLHRMRQPRGAGGGPLPPGDARAAPRRMESGRSRATARSASPRSQPPTLLRGIIIAARDAAARDDGDDCRCRCRRCCCCCCCCGRRGR
eukprot:scaffold1085_cov407-Prasinococcus_capsulatus_cf.AAC.94